MPDDDLPGLLVEVVRRAAARGETPAQKWARYRGYLVAAFGEADVAAAEDVAAQHKTA